MKILVLVDTFLPEISALSFRTDEHARVWMEHGHEVTVVTCAPNWPRGRVFPGYRNRPYQVEERDGLRVIRVGTYVAPNRGVLRRTLDYMSFAASASAWCWRFPPFDVALASSPTFFCAMGGHVVGRLRRRPWVFEVRDLWPASIRAVGATHSRLLDLVERLELYLYRRAARVIAVTEAIKTDLVRRGVPAGKVDVVRNGVDPARFAQRHGPLEGRRRLGVPPDAFLAGYIGTTGMAHGLETVVQAAKRCEAQGDVWFLIMGDGARREALEEHARRVEARRVLFRDPVPHEEIPIYLGALDVGIVHLKADPVFRTAVPSKTFEFMAMGVPIVMGVEGEAAAIVAESGAGVCVPPGDAEALARAVLDLRLDPARRAAMGQRGRSAVEERFHRRRQAELALECLERAAGQRAPSPARARRSR